jgi:hypothetical protein
VRERPPLPGVAPPAELTDFGLWASLRGLPSEYDGFSPDAARAFELWERARDVWVAVHPGGEDALGLLPDAPWDPDGI